MSESYYQRHKNDPGFKAKRQAWSKSREARLKSEGRVSSSLQSYIRNRERKLEEARVRGAKLKALIIREYGGKCACCQESRLEFLSLDHTNNDGNKDRKIRGMAVTFYIKLKNSGFPKEGLQVLCFNCNMGREIYGVCPHLMLPSDIPLPKKPRDKRRKEYRLEDFSPFLAKALAARV